MSAVGVAKRPSTFVGRRGWWLVLALFIVAGLVWAGWAWWSARRYRNAMAEINAAMTAGRFGLAARNLDQILAWKPVSDEAAYVLGLCEQARGRSREATAAWARISAGSDFTQRGILARLRLIHDTGRLAAAEKLILDAAGDPRNDATDLLVLLVPVYSQIGRSDEAEGLIEARWEHLKAMGRATPEQSIKLVRVHMDLTWKALSVESLRVYLDQVGRMAPDDDRIWLGRANLAIQTGANDDAKRWLDACRRRRPDDAAVWRATLDWGVATDQIKVVQEARKHLPTIESSPADVHRLAAWLCSRNGNVECERRELEGLLAAAPADLTAMNRLAQLAEKSGQPARVAELETRKAELDQLRTRYVKLYERTQHMRDAEEMAHLADRLGRNFEARVFRTLAAAQGPERG
jgi:enediyne biosynthesis protein E4